MKKYLSLNEAISALNLNKKLNEYYGETGNWYDEARDWKEACEIFKEDHLRDFSRANLAIRQNIFKLCGIKPVSSAFVKVIKDDDGRVYFVMGYALNRQDKLRLYNMNFREQDELIDTLPDIPAFGEGSKGFGFFLDRGTEIPEFKNCVEFYAILACTPDPEEGQGVIPSSEFERLDNYNRHATGDSLDVDEMLDELENWANDQSDNIHGFYGEAEIEDYGDSIEILFPLSFFSTPEEEQKMARENHLMEFDEFARSLHGRIKTQDYTFRIHRYETLSWRDLARRGYNYDLEKPEATYQYKDEQGNLKDNEFGILDIYLID